jgi:hypothetical protein
LYADISDNSVFFWFSFSADIITAVAEESE